MLIYLGNKLPVKLVLFQTLDLTLTFPLLDFHLNPKFTFHCLTLALTPTLSLIPSDQEAILSVEGVVVDLDIAVENGADEAETLKDLLRYCE